MTSTNIKIYNTTELNYIRETIENMKKDDQIEVLRILKKYDNIVINENNYGNHINLSDLDKSVLDELTSYIKYVNLQENNLANFEKTKNEYSNKFFSE